VVQVRFAGAISGSVVAGGSPSVRPACAMSKATASSPHLQISVVQLVGHDLDLRASVDMSNRIYQIMPRYRWIWRSAGLYYAH
jgi:hypothetical protein